MNEKITNEIDDILDTNTENLSSTSNSLVKKYLFKFIIALLVISILLVPLITISIKYFFIAAVALFLIFVFFATRKTPKKEEKYWRGERIE
jgi:cell division protein FtsW (lipid II flippase)